jgi:imidazolonepropionase
MNDLACVENAACAILEGKIVGIGPVAEIEAAYEAQTVIDLGRAMVMPGFIDPHTHPVFRATREREFEMRNQGRSYVDIATEGGGIRSTVRDLRDASEDELVVLLEKRARQFLRAGTTTIEAKSGYGLSTESELKSLRAIRRVNESSPLDLHATFLGAHEIPDEYRDDREAYIDLIIHEMLPAVASDDLASWCDVFCEDHVFTVEESRRILLAAAELGLRARLHADEIVSTGGAELAADVGAITADHLVAISEKGIQRLKEDGVIPVLLPGTSFYLNLPNHAPGRKMLDSGLPIALATDFNPGSCHTQSMPMILTLACLSYGMTTAECITAACVNNAWAIGRQDEIGRLDIGLYADIIAMDLDNPHQLPYHFGTNHVSFVMKSGSVCHNPTRTGTLDS